MVTVAAPEMRDSGTNFAGKCLKVRTCGGSFLAG
jgi:hypothetical protein